MYDRIITVDNRVIDFIVRGVTIFISSNLVLLIIYGRSEEFKYYVDLVIKKIRHK